MCKHQELLPLAFQRSIPLRREELHATLLFLRIKKARKKKKITYMKMMLLKREKNTPGFSVRVAWRN